MPLVSYLPWHKHTFSFSLHQPIFARRFFKYINVDYWRKKFLLKGIIGGFSCLHSIVRFSNFEVRLIKKCLHHLNIPFLQFKRTPGSFEFIKMIQISAIHNLHRIVSLQQDPQVSNHFHLMLHGVGRSLGNIHIMRVSLYCVCLVK